MIEITGKNDLKRIRKLMLDAQGLLKVAPFGAGLTSVQQVIEHLGYVQLDTISVVERSHHHVLFSRLPDYSPAFLGQQLKTGKLFEYWSHAAAILPIQDYRFSLPYKHAIKSGQTHWFKHPDKGLMKQILARIKAEGPLKSRDLSAAPTGQVGAKKHQGWWDWKPGKKALEQLFMEGDVMVCQRDGFQKTYDLTERVLPYGVDTQMPSAEEFAERVIEHQLRCQGVVSLKGFNYHQRRNSELRQAIKSRVLELCAERHIEQIRLANGDVFYLEAGLMERRLPRLSNRLHILSPFDNAVIQRDKLRSLFQFDYQLECYLPAGKRQYGYFSLPLLYRAEFIGRMDCKVHRKQRQLEIKALHFEQTLPNNRDFDAEQLTTAFSLAISDFMVFQDCDHIVLGQVEPDSPFNKLLQKNCFD